MCGKQKGKGKDGKGNITFTGTCFGCGETGHRIADCPTGDPKRAVNPLSESPDEDWEDENGDEGWGCIAVVGTAPPVIRTAPPGLPTPTKNRWSALSRVVEEPDEPNQYGYREDDDDYNDPHVS